jgi:hypothetical protein
VVENSVGFSIVFFKYILLCETYFANPGGRVIPPARQFAAAYGVIRQKEFFLVHQIALLHAPYSPALSP